MSSISRLTKEYPPQQLILEKKLRESEERYRSLFEQAAEGIFTVDLRGYIISANQAAVDLIKIPRPRVIGSHLMRYLDRPSLKKALQSFYQIKDKGHPVVRDELIVLDRNKDRIDVEFTASPLLKGPDLFQVHVIIRDIRRKKSLERFIVETEKMAALQHFISGTTQEIETPLKDIVDLSRQLLKQYKDRHFEYIGFKEYQEIFRTLGVINQEIQGCYETVNRLVRLHKKQAGIVQQYCDVNSIVRQTVHLHKNQMENAQVDLQMQLGQLPLVAIGVIELDQVVTNVLVNAIQSIISHGRIFIKTSLNQKDGMIHIDVRDDGVGIPKEYLSRVFEPFFTTKQKGLEKSKGLGLSVVYSIIKSHHGNIHIVSHPHKGTLVKMALPVYDSRRQ